MRGSYVKKSMPPLTTVGSLDSTQDVSSTSVQPARLSILQPTSIPYHGLPQIDLPSLQLPHLPRLQTSHPPQIPHNATAAMATSNLLRSRAEAPRRAPQRSRPRRLRNHPTRKATTEALRQPHSLRELHLPSRARCSGECDAE